MYSLHIHIWSTDRELKYDMQMIVAKTIAAPLGYK